MKAQKIYFLLSLILVIVFAMSCAQASGSSQTPLSPTLTLFVNTVIPTSTLLPTLANTPTTIPTLPPELARARLLDLLFNNSNCRLPCLWGITPGKSAYQDAQNILTPLTSIAYPMLLNLSSSPSNINLSFSEEDTEIDTNLRFLYGNDGIVSRIGFQVRVSKKVAASGSGWMSQDIFDSKTFGEQVRAYMLPQVLTEQGVPAAVLLQTAGTLVKDSGGFRILLFYPEQGLLIYYETQMKIIGDKVQGCFANAHVEMELFPSGDLESFSNNLDSTYWADLWPPPVNDNPFWKPIDKATSMSLNQFYEIFRQPTDKCIETPASIWMIR